MNSIVKHPSHCKNGHEHKPDTSYIFNGRLVCKLCPKKSNTNRYIKHKAMRDKDE